MIFYGKVGSYFGNQTFVENTYMGSKFNTLLMSNMIVDMINIEESLDISKTDIVKPVFDMNTALLADFKNNLEGGNFNNEGIKIQYLRFKRRKVGELKWQTMTDILFDISMENYDISDFFIENATDYEYTLVPVTQSMEGTGVLNSIETDYISLFLTGRDDKGVLCNYPLRFDSSASEITLNEDKTIVKTLSSKYPAILCGDAKYYSGNIVSDLISPTTVSANGKVNMKAEKVYREAFEEFIHSGKPMLIRNHSLYILGVLNEIKKNEFDEACAFGIFVYSMGFNETANSQDMITLKENNLTYDIITS